MNEDQGIVQRHIVTSILWFHGLNWISNMRERALSFRRTVIVGQVHAHTYTRVCEARTGVQLKDTVPSLSNIAPFVHNTSFVRPSDSSSTIPQIEETIPLGDARLFASPTTFRANPKDSRQICKRRRVKNDILDTRIRARVHIWRIIPAVTETMGDRAVEARLRPAQREFYESNKRNVISWFFFFFRIRSIAPGTM